MTISVVAAWPDNEYVFTTTIGTALEYSNVLKAWRELLERADVPYPRPDGRGGPHELPVDLRDAPT